MPCNYCLSWRSGSFVRRARDVGHAARPHRGPARVLLASLMAAGVIVWFQPLARLDLIAQVREGSARPPPSSPRGSVPLRVRATGGSHADLVPGQVGTLAARHLSSRGSFRIDAGGAPDRLVVAAGAITWLVPLQRPSATVARHAALRRQGRHRHRVPAATSAASTPCFSPPAAPRSSSTTSGSPSATPTTWEARPSATRVPTSSPRSSPRAAQAVRQPRHRCHARGRRGDRADRARHVGTGRRRREQRRPGADWARSPTSPSRTSTPCSSRSCAGTSTSAGRPGGPWPRMEADGSSTSRPARPGAWPAAPATAWSRWASSG